MKIKVNLKSNFKIVQEGERTLEITEAKGVPSGAPTKLELLMKDVEDGASLRNSYNLENETGNWLAGMLVHIALNLDDGEELDPKDFKKLVGVKLLCEVAHSEYNDKTYANVKKIISRVEDTSNSDLIKQIDETLYPREAIASEDDLD